MTDLRSHRFRQEREADWRRLEGLLQRLEKGGARRLSDEQLLALPALYRGALSSLSVARATSLDQGLVDYLESLAARSYFYVYGSRTTVPERLARFFVHDWPASVRGLWRETLVSLVISVLCVAVGYGLVAHDPNWYYALMPDALEGGRNPAASTGHLREILYDGQDQNGLSVFATFLFTHNAQIAIMAFALGFAFCLPTALLLGMNGLTLGAIYALYVSRGLGAELTGWLMIHGVTELFAVTLAGAAGFRIGWSVGFPGDKARLEAAAEAGRQAGLAMGGVVVMLMVAGALEGFGRQRITSDAVRYGIAAGSAALWGAYFYWPRRARADG